MSAAASRLAEIADRQRALAAEQSALAEEAAELVEQLGGDGAETESSAADILTSNHVTVAQLAGRLRASEKTARAIGVAAGARFQIGGRVLYDLAAVRRHVTSANYRALPCSSLFQDGKIADDAIDEGR